MQNPFAQFVSMLIGQLPGLLAYVAGLVICVLRWNRYPRPAQLAFLGTSFLLIAAVGHPLVSVWLRGQLSGNSASQLADMYAILGLVAVVVRATGYGFLLGAVFFGRAAHAGAGFSMASVAATPPLQSSPSDRTLL